MPPLPVVSDRACCDAPGIPQQTENESGMPASQHIHTLHRYYMWSTILHAHFSESLEALAAAGGKFMETDEALRGHTRKLQPADG